MLDESRKRTFLVQALPLMASYLHSRTVELQPFEVGTGQSSEQREEFDRFLSELGSRHAIASCMQLRDVVTRIELEYSQSSTLVTSEDDRLNIDQLDIPRYLSGRFQHTYGGKRVFPLRIRVSTPATPENALVVRVLATMSVQLGQVSYSKSSAEGRTANSLYNWCRARLRRFPWDSVGRLDSIERLQRETARRIRRRQTGNEGAYSDLIKLINEWQLNVSNLGASAQEDIVDGLLAFPQGDFFWDRVFEVWCLSKFFGLDEAEQI